MRLILAEKTLMAMSIAYCIGATEKVPCGKKFYWQGNDYIVTNAIGHLVDLGLPQDYGYLKWRMSDLPMVPDFKLFAQNGYKGQLE